MAGCALLGPADRSRTGVTIEPYTCDTGRSRVKRSTSPTKTSDPVPVLRPLEQGKKNSIAVRGVRLVVRVCGGCVRCAPARPCSRLLAAARSFFPPFLLHGLQAGYVKRAVWWRARELTGLGTDRAEVTPETPLVAFCNEAKYTQKGRKEMSLAECFEDMTVDDLCGYTEDKLML